MTSGICDGRVAIVTGAGGGIGRGHALELARQGASVVVNDLGGAVDGTGSDKGAAQKVVEEIEAMGGNAVANTADVSDWGQAEAMVQQAVDTFGKLDVLVNNAGILRDRMLFNMSEAEWDAVIKVHLKGTFAPLRFAAEYWRELAKKGEPLEPSVINTSSTSGLFANPGQANYGAAKTGIATLTQIASKELGRYGVRANAIAPGARTRMTENLGGGRPKPAEGEWDPGDANNVAPMVTWLASTEAADVTGRIFLVSGGRVAVANPFTRGPGADKKARWDPAELGPVVKDLLAQADAD